jgi:predicted DNA-binding antitoxin AbrB/MazE fold protein
MAMAITVEAIDENGVLTPPEPLALKDKERVRVTLHTDADIQNAMAVVERSYGLLGWTGDHATLERLLAEAGEPRELQ